jgi:ATP phosphoribosyltransferase
MSLLRVAVPNKGSLSGAAMQLLTDAGYQLHRNNRELSMLDLAHGVEFFFQRAKDIAVYVGSGALDVGITGRDLLQDSGAAAREILPLGFAKSKFRFAAKPGGVSEVAGLDGLKVATSYPTLVGKYLVGQGVGAHLVKLEGAVENAVALGLADAVADVVETGTSLRNAGLEAFGEPILASEAVLVRTEEGRKLSPELETAVEVLVQRLQGVLHAREFVLIDYVCREEVVDRACELTPGRESPTLSRLAKDGWVAVRSLVERRGIQRLMDELMEIGAEAILVTKLEACRI